MTGIVRGVGAWLVAVAGVATAAETLATSTDDPSTAAVAFAVEHHPDLVPLLERLRTEAPVEYAAAVTDLDRTRERLARILDRQPERYAAALADWKLSSRIRLAMARLSTNPSASAERELRNLVRQRAEARLSPLRAERDRITSRLEKIDSQIEAFDRDPEAAITKEFESLRSKAARDGGRSGPTKKPAKQPEPAAAPESAVPPPASAAL